MQHLKIYKMILSGIGLFVLISIFAHWRATHPSIGTLGLLAALCSVGLFAVFGVRFVSSWMDEWHTARTEHPSPRVREPVKAVVLIKIFLICLLAEAAALLLVYVFRVINKDEHSFWDAAQVWLRLDSQHYIDIARDWYLSEGELDRLVQLVFLPGYPLVIRFFHLFINDWLKSAMTVSALSFGCAGTMLYCLARLDTDHTGALRVLKYTLILPGAFFFAAPMSESLFLLLSVSCLYFIRTKRWLLAGLLGGAAAFTRSLGIVLLAPAIYALITDTIAPQEDGWSKAHILRRVAEFCSALLILAGFGAYCLICRAVSGNAFQFLIYQREHWGQSPGLFFNTAAYQTDNAINMLRQGNTELALGLWIPNVFCSLFSLAVLVVSVKKLKPVYSLYFLSYYVMAIGATWLLSAPRYLVAYVPLSMGLSAVTDDCRADDILTVVLTILYGFYAMFMALRWQVW